MGVESSSCGNEKKTGRSDGGGGSSVVDQLPSMHKTSTPHKPGGLVHACNPSPEEVKTGGAEVQGLYRVFEATSSYMKPCLKNQKGYWKLAFCKVRYCAYSIALVSLENNPMIPHWTD